MFATKERTMNRKQRKRKLERAKAHQARPRTEPQMRLTTAPAKPRRKRTMSKRAVRALGRKVRSDA